MRLSLFWLGCASTAAVVATMLAFIAVTAPRRDLDRFMREVGTVEVGKTKLELAPQSSRGTTRWFEFRMRPAELWRRVAERKQATSQISRGSANDC